jgi:hypothetical protein
MSGRPASQKKVRTHRGTKSITRKTIPIPQTTFIGGHRVKVKKKKIWETDNAAGYYYQGNIYLDPRNTPSDQQETYIHELIEAINHKYDLKLAHHKIQSLALALHQALTSGVMK